jgi:hypothetical protein
MARPLLDEAQPTRGRVTMKSNLLFALPVALSLGACTDIQSGDVKTAGMSAHISVTADGTGQSTAVAQLNVDSNVTDFVTLTSGDQIVASVAGQSETMSRSDILNDISYAASFTGDDGSGAAYTVAFNRMSDTSAPNSTCTLPSEFAITSPAAGASFSRASAIAVAYGAAGTSDTMSYSVSGGCVDGPLSAGIGSDPGAFTVAAGAIKPVDTSSAGQTCQATLTVTRTRVGQLDPAFGSGGEIQCMQSRSVTFTSTP